MDAQTTELLIRLDERVKTLTTDINAVKERLEKIEVFVAEDKNKRVGMYTLIVSIGAIVSWILTNLYAFKNWIIP